MKKLLLVGVVGLSALLGGCVSSEQMPLPDGSVGFLIECNGTMNNMASCYKEAAKLCPNGFQSAIAENAMGLATNLDGSPIATHSRSIMAKCN